MPPPGCRARGLAALVALASFMVCTASTQGSARSVPVQQPSQEQPAEVCLDAPAGPAPAAAPTGRCHLDLQIGEYCLGRKLGMGAFGAVLLGTHISTGEQVAVKVESPKAQHQQLQWEYEMLKLLAGGPGIPGVRSFGVELEQNVMVFDLLGPSVDALAGARGGGRLGLKSALLVVGQVLDSLEFVHSKLLVHRDIKPQNFLVGARGGPAAARVHLVDFGTSAPYRHPQTRAHAPWAQDATGMVGNALYASANAHQGVQLARRDDVESLSYVLVRFLKGALPWEGVDEGRTLQPHQIVALMRAKQAATPLAELCAGLPPEVGAFVAHARGLRYDQEPDYALLRKLLGAMMEREGHARDYVYDWDDADVLAAAAK